MAKASGGGGRGGLRAPAGSSKLVREAYSKGVSAIRFGLTKADIRKLNAGVKRGDLMVTRNYLTGTKQWQPNPFR